MRQYCILARSLVICIISAAFCLPITPLYADTSASLNDVLTSIHGEWDQLEGKSQEHQAHRQLWIDRLELAIAQSNHPVLQASAMPVLGTLLERNNELAAAEAVYSQLAANTIASASNRLDASLSAFDLAVTLGLEEQALSHLDSFESIYDDAKSDKTIIDSFGIQRAVSNTRRAAACRTIAFRKAAALAASGNLSAAKETECVGLQQSLTYLSKHLELLDDIDLPEQMVEHMNVRNVGLEGTLLHYAATASEAASRIENKDGGNLQKDLYRQARDKLKDMLVSFPGGRLSVSGGDIFIEAVSHTAVNPSEEIEAAQWWMERSRPGHGVLSALRERAVILQNSGLQSSGQPECIEGSSGLFKLIMEGERRWYPDEYMQHTNYQWAVVAEAENMLHFGNVAEAVRLLDELKSTELQGSFIERSVESLTRSINNYYAPVDQMLDETVKKLAAESFAAESETATQHNQHDGYRLEDTVMRAPSERTTLPAPHSTERDAFPHTIVYVGGVCVGIMLIAALGVMYIRYHRQRQSK